MKQRYDLPQLPLVAETIIAILETRSQENTTAVVVGLTGELGTGKTTLVQAIARVLGVKEVLVSPTFVVAKFYEVIHPLFDTLVHMDAYRIESLDELVPLGWETLMQHPRTLVIVEWPDRISSALPKDTIHYQLVHDGQHRIISNEKIN